MSDPAGTPAVYRPTLRPWYQQAVTNASQYSAVYDFITPSGVPALGVTAAQRFIVPNTTREGVFGIDISLAELSSLMVKFGYESTACCGWRWVAAAAAPPIDTISPPPASLPLPWPPATRPVMQPCL